MEYNELKDLYHKHFWIGGMSSDISDKFALISLICYVTFKLKTKNPDTTHWSVVYKLGKDIVSEDVLKAISVICSEFDYGCTSFPTFGIEDKQIPNKIKELLGMILPF